MNISQVLYILFTVFEFIIIQKYLYYNSGDECCQEGSQDLQISHPVPGCRVPVYPTLTPSLPLLWQWLWQTALHTTQPPTPTHLWNHTYRHKKLVSKERKKRKSPSSSKHQAHEKNLTDFYKKMKKSNPAALPPCYASFEQQAFRSNLVANMWRQAPSSRMTMRDKTKHGYKVINGKCSALVWGGRGAW